MRLLNCPICNKPFVKKSKDICPSCAKLEVEYLSVVSNYLLENRNASVEQVADDTNIPKKFINRLIREGRVKVSYVCRKCGSKMDAGSTKTICEQCSQMVFRKLLRSMEKTSSKEVPSADKLAGFGDNDRKYGLGSK